MQRDFDKPALDAAFPGWPVEAGFQLLTPGETEPAWMTFMRKQQGGGLQPDGTEDAVAAGAGGGVVPGMDAG